MISGRQSAQAGDAIFDGVANEYHASAPQPPPAYCDLIIRERGLRAGSRVIELGCGAGGLARALAERGMQVTAVDCSMGLLDIARRSDHKSAVEWVQSWAEDFHPSVAGVDLVLSYEAFHLFSSKERIVTGAAQYLRPGGGIGLGWCEYHWEPMLRDEIISGFASVGVEWGEWGYQACPEFIDIIDLSAADFYRCSTTCIEVPQCTPLATTAQFLSSIGKATAIEGQARRVLRDRLLTAFTRKVGQEVLCGQSRYWFRSATRR